MAKFLNISEDTTLGGNSPSDMVVSSQKAIKTYVDSQTTGSNSFLPYGESTSEADAVQKEVTISSITSLTDGQIIIVTPTITSTVADSTLKLNNFTAYPMKYGSAAITTSTDSVVWSANYPSWFRFDGSNWVFLGHGVDNNTTYSAMTTANGIAGTETTARLMRADRLKPIIQGTKLTGLSTSTNSAVVATDSITVGIGKLQAQVNNAVMKSAASQQTIALSSGTGTTALGVTSKSTSSYISFSGTGGWIGSYGVSSDKKPVFYNGTGYTLAYTSDIPTVNNATLTIQKNGSNVATFTANASSNVTANISVPTKVSDLTNDSGFITGVTSTDVTTALGYTPYNSTNPNGYQANVIETVKVNGTALTPSSKAVDIIVPTVDQTYSATSTHAQSGVAVANAIAPKQDTLVSGTNIKTINGASLLGSGNITIETSSTPNVDGTTISYNSSEALQTIAVKNKRDDSTLPIWHGTEYQWNHGDPTTWYYWQTSVTAQWVSGGSLPSSAYWYSVAYGDGRFVAITSASNKSAYSTDGGVTWQSDGSLPYRSSWRSVAYGDGKFVAITYNNNKSAYSTDGGVTWQSGGSLPYSASWRSVAYGDGKFVAIIYYADLSAYSTDGGVTWQSDGSLPSSEQWCSVAYGDGKFVSVCLQSDKSAIFSLQYDKCYTDTANPTTTSVVYSAPETTSALTISSVTSGAITLNNNNTYYYNQSGNAYTYQSVGTAHPDWLCFINGVGVKIGNTTIATA